MEGLSLSTVHAKSLQLCPTLCDPMDCNLPGSSVRGILQARILEWIVMPSPKDMTQGLKLLTLMSLASLCLYPALITLQGVTYQFKTFVINKPLLWN